MKRNLYILIAALALALMGVAVAFAAPGDKPPSPPGQGPCEHGNSGKPCKDDPQPDHGQDCDEHGPKEGGVNEDHCKGETPTTPTETTPTDTVPTDTTPTQTTPTTPEPGTPTTPEEPSTTPTETPAEPQEPGAEEQPGAEEPSGEPPVIVKVTPGSKPGTVVIETSDGEKHVGVQGQG